MPGLNDLLPLFDRGDRLTSDWVSQVSRQLNGLSNAGDAQQLLTVGKRQYRGVGGRRPIEPDLVLVRNDTGAALTAEHPVVGLGDTLVLPSDVETVVHRFPPAFAGETPDSGHEGKFAVLLGPVSDGGWQLGIVSGVVWVKILVEDEDSLYADISKNNATRLKTAVNGAAQILWIDPDAADPDERWALVRLSNPGVLIRDAELTANLSAASNSKTGATTAAAKFLVPDPDNPGDLKDGDAFTVTNRSLDATGLSGDYIVVAKIAGEWRPIWIDC